ncbi:MAG: Gfo/Idh/MocA family protein [Planctomycetaceae bacterium]
MKGSEMSQRNVLVIGAGSIGERHARCFLATGRARVAVVEPRAEIRERMARDYGIATHAKLDEALASPFDAAVICTPAPLHIPQATRLVEAGLHVLLEKPVSTSEQGLPELERLLAARRTVLSVAYVYRAFPELREMRDRLTSGEWGAPLELTVTAGQHFPTYRPAYREIYYTRHETGGGAIQDALTHLLNLGEWLVGPIHRLVCDAAHLALPGVTVEDTVHLLARHSASRGATRDERGPGGSPAGVDVLASYALNQHQAPNEIQVQVVCERGTVKCEVHGQRLKWMTAPQTDWQQREFGPRERDAVYQAQAEAFLDALDGKGNVACTLREGWQTLRVNLAALQSAREGSWQNLPGWPE